MKYSTNYIYLGLGANLRSLSYNNINILSCYIEKNNFKHLIKFLLLKSKVKSINFLKRFEIIKKMYRQLTRILR